MSSKTKSKKEISPEAKEEAEKLVEEFNASDDDSIACLEVSEHEEQKEPEQKNKKKRKRPSDDPEEEHVLLRYWLGITPRPVMGTFSTLSQYNTFLVYNGAIRWHRLL